MAHKISNDCINCGACEPVCPVIAISENNGKRVINAETCINCDMCTPECPVNAISQE